MNSPAILQRHPGLRWLVPFGIAGVAGLAAFGVFRTSTTAESLPRTTPAALMAAVQENHVDGFSGTVVSHLSLGLPELPELPNAGDETSFDALLSGSHTMQVWYGGADRQRVALLGPMDETDLFHNGRQVWQWSSSDHVALHAVLPARAAAGDGPPVVVAPMTPRALARTALEAVDPTTTVTVDYGRTVADRSAYELVLTPRTPATKVGSVHISVDGATKVPLGVQVYPRGSSSAAIDVAFTSIKFAAQPDRNFVFSPPPTAVVRDFATEVEMRRTLADLQPTVAGAGWTTVLGIRAERAAAARAVQRPLQQQLTPVSGSWGSGRLLDAPLLSALITDDGRVFAGAVYPADLYAAAGAK